MHSAQHSQTNEAVPVPNAPRLVPIPLPIVPTFFPADLVTPPSTPTNDVTPANNATPAANNAVADDVMSTKETIPSPEMKRRVKEKVNFVLSAAVILRTAF
jgi:hypothetical protein